MDLLITLERKQFQHRYKVKTLETGIQQLEYEIDYFQAAQKLRKEQHLDKHLVQLVHKHKAVQIPSENVLRHLESAASELLNQLKSLKASGIASGAFSYHDLQPPAYKAQPVNTVKQGGHYDPRGYPTYINVYSAATGQWIKYPTQSDAKGFYIGNHNYFYKFKNDYGSFQDSESESEGPAPAAPPIETTKKAAKKRSQKSTSKKTKTKKKPLKPNRSNKSIPTKGHGLALLLAQAKDPPALQVTGITNIVKGVRRRLLLKKHLFVDITSLFHWSGTPDHSFIILFKSEEQRTEFLEQKTRSDIQLRFCTFK
nr:MAG: E2 protein [Betta papillomavirus 1]